MRIPMNFYEGNPVPNFNVYQRLKGNEFEACSVIAENAVEAEAIALSEQAMWVPVGEQPFKLDVVIEQITQGKVQ